VLDKLVKALRPGGWLLIEDFAQMPRSDRACPEANSQVASPMGSGSFCGNNRGQADFIGKKTVQREAATGVRP